MLNRNKVGRHLAKIENGQYNGMLVSVYDNCASNANQEQAGIMKEFRQLKIAKATTCHRIPDTTNEQALHYVTGASGSGKSAYARNCFGQYVNNNSKTDLSI